MPKAPAKVALPAPAKAAARPAAGAAVRPMPGPAPSSSSSGTYQPLWIAMALGAFMILSLPACILIFFGMMPTVVSYIIDRTEQKYAAFCVGSLNVCGVFPFILEVWTGDHTPAQAFQILGNVFKLFLMFGSAALGWALFALIPPIVSAIMVMVAKQRVEQLKLIQQTLITDWGQEVSEPPRAAVVPKAAPARRRRRA